MTFTKQLEHQYFAGIVHYSPILANKFLGCNSHIYLNPRAPNLSTFNWTEQNRDEHKIEPDTTEKAIDIITCNNLGTQIKLVQYINPA